MAFKMDGVLERVKSSLPTPYQYVESVEKIEYWSIASFLLKLKQVG